MQPLAECVNATDSTLFLRWLAPNISMECMDQLVAFPTLNYEVTYSIGSIKKRMVRSYNTGPAKRCFIRPRAI